MSNLVVRTYRKKPVAIQAIQIAPSNIEFVENWCHGSIKGVLLPKDQQCIDIQTLAGEVRADMGDWIIQGVEGEFYPCTDPIFQQTYEAM